MFIKRNHYLFILCFFFSGFSLRAQEILCVDSIYGIFAPHVSFGFVDVGQCSHTFLEEVNGINKCFDIFLRQDGTMFEFIVTQGFNDTVLSRDVLPVGTGEQFTDAITMDKPKNGITSDEYDFIYAAGKGITRLDRFDNCCTYGETYFGDLPPEMACEGGLTYRKGKFYLHSINDQLVEVNMKDPSKSRAVMDFPDGILPIDALTTVQVGCDSSITYAIGRASNNSKIYEIDFGDWTLTEVCDLPLSIVGAGSQTEGMLPPCDILLDLDSDNSSLAFQGNYCAEAFCVPPAAVSDTDVVIVSALGDIESIVLQLTGVQDGTEEYLVAGTANNINVIGNNSISVTLENNGNASIADFENAIKEIRYYNNAIPFTSGMRKVQVTAFAGGESSSLSIADLPLSNEHIETVAVVNEPRCYGLSDGSINVTSEGGIAPYTNEWATGQEEAFLDDLASGTYFLLVTDASGCAKPDSFSLEEPDTLVVEILNIGPAATCSDLGKLEGIVSGGTAPFSYSWNNGAQDSLNTDLSAGAYELIVEDSNGCSAVASMEIPFGDTVLANQDETLCQGETLIWNGMELSQDTVLCQVFVQPNGCDSSVCLSLKVNPLPNLSINADGHFCEQDEVILSAGAHENYFWSTGEESPEITVSDPGIYQVTVTNDFDCKSSALVELVPGVDFDVLADNPSCFGDEDGVIVVENVSGGLSPFRYSIDGGSQFQNDRVFEGLPPGNYEVMVEDASGCQQEIFLILDAPDPIFLDAIDDLEINLGESIVLDAATNLTDPTVIWQPSDYLDCPSCLTTNAQPVFSIQYEIEVVDSNGCSAKDEVDITVIDQSGIFIPTAFSPNGDGINDFFTVYAGASIYEVASLDIFERWGGLIFQKRNFLPNVDEEGWDGQIKNEPGPVGTYVFIVELLNVDGSRRVYHGEVNLLH
ncbi:MAG: gliding motility-associated C-terminal domain-containing protein [Bacteroidota bacterium]